MRGEHLVERLGQLSDLIVAVFGSAHGIILPFGNGGRDVGQFENRAGKCGAAAWWSSTIAPRKEHAVTSRSSAP